MKSFLRCCFGATALLGCSSPTPPSPAAPVPVDAGAQPTDPAQPPDAGQLTLRGVARSPRAIAPVRDHHVTLVAEIGGSAFLYVLGGTDAWKEIHADVQRAPIAADGALGAFEKIGDLPEPRAGHCAVLVDGTLVVAGGATPSGTRTTELDSTLSAKLRPDGTLEPWAKGPKLPSPAMHHTCNSSGRRVYVVGGRVEGNYTGTLAVRMDLGEDGRVTAVTPIARLPQSLGFHQAFIHDSGLYVAGGLHRDPPMADFDRKREILRAGLLDDGTTGAWQKVGDLPEPRNVGAAEVVGDRVLFWGGVDGRDRVVDTIVEGVFAEDGSLASFTSLEAKLTRPRMHVHQTPRFGRWMYAVGGRNEDGASLGEIDVGSFE